MKFNDFEEKIALYGVHPDKWPQEDRDQMLSLIAVNRKADEVIRTYARIEAGLENLDEPTLKPHQMAVMQDNVMDLIQNDGQDEGEEESVFKYILSIAASFILGLIVANSDVGANINTALFGDDDLTADDVAFMALSYENTTIVEDDEEGQDNETN